MDTKNNNVSRNNKKLQAHGSKLHAVAQCLRRTYVVPVKNGKTGVLVRRLPLAAWASCPA